MELTLKNLENCFKGAKNNNAKYIGIAVKNINSSKAEIIINPEENFDDKLAYYKEAYNNNLELKSYPKISIIGFSYGNNFEELENDLIF